MTDNHPITSPPELLAQWEDDILNSQDNVDYVLDCAWKNGFQAGADQELEACINYFHEYDTSWGEDSDLIAGLRAARRLKPPSLKELALELLDKAEDPSWDINDFSIVRKALEQLDD